MATAYGPIVVASTATLIVGADSRRRGCLVGNNSAVTVFIGPDINVTTTNGIPLLANSNFANTDSDALFRGDIYGIVVTGTADVRFWSWTP